MFKKFNSTRPEQAQQPSNLQPLRPNTEVQKDFSCAKCLLRRQPYG